MLPLLSTSMPAGVTTPVFGPAIVNVGRMLTGVGVGDGVGDGGRRSGRRRAWAMGVGLGDPLGVGDGVGRMNCVDRRALHVRDVDAVLRYRARRRRERAVPAADRRSIGTASCCLR